MRALSILKSFAVWRIAIPALIPAAFLVSSASRYLSEDGGSVPRFEREVLPILQANCVTCHGEKLKKNGLDLRTLDSLLKGGESGPAIGQGAAKDSLLFQKILSGVMRPGDKKLSAEKVGLIRRWIDSGALKLGEEAQASKGPAPKPVTEQEVMVNVFEARCITCHGKWQRDGGLDLRTRAS